ncbi:MAG: hypothetical protein JST92_08010 [Deltaproteobacteria bacterium]|nr:hypothetical protein [Deltaproteobacteria bacterium]
MSLDFQGPRGSIEQRWIIYALLRDNVQHHLEGGRQGDGFQALHGLQLALGGRPVSVSARRLHDELLKAQRELPAKPIDQLAVSGRTRAVISLTFPIPEVGETMLVAGSGVVVEPVRGARTLGDVFGFLLDDLLRVTRDAGPDDQVVVTDL